jgi:hypothetical protein
MSLKRNHFMYFAMVPVLVGCGSIGDLRNQPADRVIMVTGTYDSLAKCVANEADAISDYVGVPSLRFNDSERTASLFNLIQPSMTPQYEIAFTQQGKDRVKVEGRGMRTIYGTDFHLRKLWPAVERCATKVQRASGKF